jgi:hypothetical protein
MTVALLMILLLLVSPSIAVANNQNIVSSTTVETISDGVLTMLMRG